MSQLLGPALFNLPGTPINIYGEANSVPATSTATIASYTVPAGKKLFLDFTDFAGETIAVYFVEIASTQVAEHKLHWGAGISGIMWFNGLEVAAASVVDLKVNNFRSEACDFSGRIVGRIIDV